MVSAPLMEATSQDVQIRLFTVDEFLRMSEAGLFPEGERVELIDGRVIEKVSPQSVRHLEAVQRLLRYLMRLAGDELVVASQAPLGLDLLNEVEPDIYVFEGDFGLPKPEALRLVVEVSLTSLPLDRGRKASLYAESEIPEYWIVNLAENVIEVYTLPTNGRYSNVVTVNREQPIAPAFAAGNPVLTGSLLPKSEA